MSISDRRATEKLTLRPVSYGATTSVSDLARQICKSPLTEWALPTSVLVRPVARRLAIAKAMARLTPRELSIYHTPETAKAVRYSPLDAEEYCDHGRPKPFVSKCWRHPDTPCMCRPRQ